MFEDWESPPGFGNIYSHTEILTPNGVKVRCMVDPYHMFVALYTNDGKQIYDKPTVNERLLSREEFVKFQYYGFHRRMIRCENPPSLVISLVKEVEDSDFPGQTVRIVMQKVDMKHNADGDIDFVGTMRLMQYPHA